MSAPHDCQWEGRPEGSTRRKQHYRCVLCGLWAKRLFGGGKISAIIAYPAGTSFDEPVVVEPTRDTADFYDPQRDETYTIHADELEVNGLSILDPEPSGG